MCNSQGRPDPKSPRSCNARVKRWSLGAALPQRGQGRAVSMRCSLMILGLGRSSTREKAVSGIYSPGPTLGEVLEAGFFMPPVYLSLPVSAPLRRWSCYSVEKHADPADPPRCRANNRRGHGTYANDRPPVIGTVGRESGQVRLRVAKRTDKRTLHKHVHTFTRRQAHSNTDEWRSYNGLARSHSTVCHGKREWARDDDGDGINEVHVNTIEGLWTSTRNFLRPFRGVHKKNLQNYLAICEFKINQKRVSPAFIAQLSAQHKVCR